MEVICLQDEAFYSLIEEVVARLKEKNEIKEDRWISSQGAYFMDNNTGKAFNGFAFRNDRDGYEISVPNPAKGTSFKTVIGAKAPTTFTNRESDTALIFEGFWDYL